jgi:hypothetical protein
VAVMLSICVSMEEGSNVGGPGTPAVPTKVRHFHQSLQTNAGVVL